MDKEVVALRRTLSSTERNVNAADGFLFAPFGKPIR